jgi:hypothetical protein
VGNSDRLPFGRVVALALPLVATVFLSPVATSAQSQFVVTPVVEKKVSQLPAGPLYWRIENLPTLAQAQAAAAPTALVAEASGKVWLFTLGPTGGSTPGATKVVEIGPVPAITAPEYLLRVNRATEDPGSMTAMHSHEQLPSRPTFTSAIRASVASFAPFCSG